MLEARLMKCIESRVKAWKRQRAYSVGDYLGSITKRGECLLSLFRRSSPAHHDLAECVAMAIGWNERRGWSNLPSKESPKFSWSSVKIFVEGTHNCGGIFYLKVHWTADNILNAVQPI